MATTIKTKNSTTAATAPTGLVQGELAVNITDKKLYVGDSVGNSIQIAGAGATNAAGGSNTQVQYNSSGALAGSANFVFDGSNLGVGIAPPAYTGNRLFINSSTYASSEYFISSTRTAYALATSTYFAVGSATSIPYTFVTNDTERMRIDSSGNVGIGTSSPSQKLHVVGNGLFDGGYTFWTATAGTPGSTAPAIWSPSTGAMGFWANSLERMRIDSSGNLLVGTTAISSSNLNGFAARPYAGGIFLEVCHNTSASSGDSYVDFRRNGTVIGTISQNGTTAVAYNTTSDYRLKENVAPMTGALAKNALLKPVTYTWKVDGSAGEGFIAHELAEVMPQAVTGEKDAVNKDGTIKPQGIDTSFLVGHLVACIQELKAEVDSLKAQLAK